MRLRKRTACATGLLALTVLMGSLAGAARADRVDDYLKAEMAHRHIPGMSVAVVQNGKVVKEQGYGLALLGPPKPATARTSYVLASLTKQFTAAAILTLAQDGKLSLDDKITQYLSGLPDTWKTLTIRHLLNQTSGLASYTDGADKDALLQSYEAAGLVSLIAGKPLAFAPGTQFEYSNTNYRLLGMIVAKAGRKPHSMGGYEAYLRRTFFEPLGMGITAINDPDFPMDRARGYLWDGSALQGPHEPDELSGFGDSGIVSSVSDLVKWNTALDGDVLLTPASKAILWTPPALPGGAPTEYAAGWIATRVGSHKLLWHNGALTTGFSCAIFKFPDDKLTVIALSNLLDLPGLRTSKPMYALTLGLAKQYLPDLAKVDAPILDTEPQTTQRLRQVLTDLAGGMAEASHFTPEMNAALTPAVIAQTNQNLATAGPFQPDSLALVSRTTENGLRVYRYRALYGKTPVIWTVHLTPDGKIAGLVPQGE